MEHECQCEHPQTVTQHEADWVNQEVGEIKIEIGKLNPDEPLFGFKDYVATVHLPSAGFYCQVLLAEHYGEMETHEVAQMLGRVLRSHFVRTRLLPLLGDLGGVTH